MSLLVFLLGGDFFFLFQQNSGCALSGWGQKKDITATPRCAICPSGHRRRRRRRRRHRRRVWGPRDLLLRGLGSRLA
jgi:hypothetical protein